MPYHKSLWAGNIRADTRGPAGDVCHLYCGGQERRCVLNLPTSPCLPGLSCSWHAWLLGRFPALAGPLRMQSPGPVPSAWAWRLLMPHGKDASPEMPRPSSCAPLRRAVVPAAPNHRTGLSLVSQHAQDNGDPRGCREPLCGRSDSPICGAAEAAPLPSPCSEADVCSGGGLGWVSPSPLQGSL